MTEVKHWKEGKRISKCFTLCLFLREDKATFISFKFDEK